MTSNDRTDATARIGIWDCAGHLAGWCPLHEASIGEDDEFCRGALNEARAILTTDDPAAVAALAATLAERHPDALLTALTNAGVLHGEMQVGYGSGIPAPRSEEHTSDLQSP